MLRKVPGSRTRSKSVPYTKGDECLEHLCAPEVRGYGRAQLGAVRHSRAHWMLSWKLGRPLLPGMIACHTCDNPSCIRPEHLYEGTPKTNATDRVKRGRQGKGETHGSVLHPESIVRGSKHPKATLTEEGVEDLLFKHFVEGRSGASLAREYKISSPQVSLILNNKAWTHVPRPPLQHKTPSER